MASKATRGELIMSSIGVVLIAAAIFLIAFYAITVPKEESFGERYVIAEIPVIFPFYALYSFKPITLIIYFIFAGVVLTLEGYKRKLRKFGTREFRILFVLIAFGSGYELLWNLLAWFTTWQTKGGSLDMLANTTHAYYQLPVNFNFATKIVFLVFATSLYLTTFLSNIERSNHYSSPRRPN